MPTLVVEKLGERYDVMRTNIKRWTVGQPIHAPLDAAEALLKRQPIDPNQVQEIVVRYQPGSITDNSGPSDINVQHALAVMLVDKTVTFRSIHDKARMQDPRDRASAVGKVRLEPGGRGAGGTRSPLLQITLARRHELTQDNVGAGVLGTAARTRCRASNWWPSAAISWRRCSAPRRPRASSTRAGAREDDKHPRAAAAAATRQSRRRGEALGISKREVDAK